MYAFSVTSVPLCRSHTEMYLNCLHSQYAIVNHISDIDTANMTLGKRGKTIVHRFYYKHDQLAERAALQPHFDHTASRSGNLLYDKTKFRYRPYVYRISPRCLHSRAAIRTDFLPFRLLWYQPLPESEQETSPESQQRSVLADQAQCSGCGLRLFSEAHLHLSKVRLLKFTNTKQRTEVLTETCILYHAV